MSARSPEPRERPIAVFDSGVGGLTVLQELLVELPHEDFLYLGDTARFPYGERSAAELERFALQIGELLLTRRAKLLVVACNAASAAALPALRERMLSTTLGVEVVGVIEPESRLAASTTRNGRVGLLATTATVRSGAYARALAAHAPDALLTSVACPDLAPIIQQGFPFDRRVVETVRGLLRAAARGRRRHGDPRLHALPADRADAPAHARARGARWSPPGARSRGPSRRSLEHAQLGATRAGEGDYRFLCTGDSPPSARSARASCRCRSRRSRRSGCRWRRPHDPRRRSRARRAAAGHDASPTSCRRRRGSALISVGRTQVICTASVEHGVPRWMSGSGRGWVTAEYGMLPASTGQRKPRDSTRGRARRAHDRDPAADRPRAARHRRLRGARRAHRLPRLRRAGRRRRHPLRLDHRRATSRSRGRWRSSSADGVIGASPVAGAVAAISCGIVDGVPLLDLDYGEDSTAEVDANVVMTGDGGPGRGAGDRRAHAALARAPRRAARAGGGRDRAAARGPGGRDRELVARRSCTSRRRRVR